MILDGMKSPTSRTGDSIVSKKQSSEVTQTREACAAFLRLDLRILRCARAMRVTNDSKRHRSGIGHFSLHDRMMDNRSHGTSAVPEGYLISHLANEASKEGTCAGGSS
jgi:hypothetical protein